MVYSSLMCAKGRSDMGACRNVKQLRTSLTFLNSDILPSVAINIGTLQQLLGATIT